LKVEGKIEVPKIDKPEVKGDLKIPVLDFDKSKVDIRSSISKAIFYSHQFNFYFAQITVLRTAP
jgi:hypothetical protein